MASFDHGDCFDGGHGAFLSLPGAGTREVWRGRPGRKQAAKLLQENMTEEEATDGLLATIAGGGVNQSCPGSGLRTGTSRASALY